MFRYSWFTLVCLLLIATAGQATSLELKIEGVEGQLQEVLETAIVLPSALVQGEQLNRRWLKHYQRQLPQRVKSTLEPYGYFYSQTSTQLREDAPGEYLFVVSVDPGQPLRISSLGLELAGPGRDNAELRQALNVFPLQVGDVLRQDYYEQGKAELLQAVVDLGFLDARYTEHEIRAHLDKRRAEISLRLDTGERYRFGLTRFSGGEQYPEPFLRRYLSYKEGEFFSHPQLGQTQLNLANSDFFKNVSIVSETEKTVDQRVPVRIDLQPAPRHQLRPGIGYGTDTGARVSLRYHNLNLFQRGHELQGDILLAENRQTLVTTYLIPDIERLDSRTQLRIGVDREDTDSYLSRELFSEVEYQRSLSEELVGSLFVRLSQEYSRIGAETTRAQMLLPGLRLTWRQVDDPLTPRRGLQTSLELLGGQERLLSDTSLLQLKGQITGLLPLPHRYSLLLRLHGGTTWHNDPLRELPASLRFFAGGDRSVRGYRYQSLGPRDASGKVVGGKHLLVANIEAERRFGENWGGAVFYDIGNAFDSFADYELEQGVGIGVRRYTRIGPIRLDLARQIGTDQTRYRLHLSVGFGW